ncbi:MAG: hypothetical protein AAGA50_23320 [Pseudomonadota bacterium]
MPKKFPTRYLDSPCKKTLEIFAVFTQLGEVDQNIFETLSKPGDGRTIHATITGTAMLRVKIEGSPVSPRTENRFFRRKAGMDRAFILGATFSLSFGTNAKTQFNRTESIQTLKLLGSDAFNCAEAIRAETAFFDQLPLDHQEPERDPHILIFLSDAVKNQEAPAPRPLKR